MTAWKAQIALVRAHPLGMLISQGEQGLVADPLPFLIDGDEQGNVVLRAHLSRANPHWALLQKVQECLVIFQGPEGYISPGWYETKRQTSNDWRMRLSGGVDKVC
ncbi:FMN-binding negative transcriptional regulator (fragment) [Serratia proteamaculans]|uniref:FMN-binding negative transcriptional regulator n=1 Tax=Serratia proteamaculans TaxID=28151 RepID=UPI0009F7F4EE